MKKKEFLERLEALIKEYDDNNSDEVDCYIIFNKDNPLALNWVACNETGYKPEFEERDDVVIEDRDELVDRFLRMLQEKK